jgi:zinc/manganese transport system permease protein
VVGALLILGLLAAPAGAATRLTTRPLRGLGLSAGIAVASMWLGLTGSYLIPAMPPSFAILAVATFAYLAALAAGRLRRRPALPPAEPQREHLERAQGQVHATAGVERQRVAGQRPLE